MIITYFLGIFCFDLKSYKVISQKDNKELQLFEVNNNRARLKENKEKEFKAGDKNMLIFEPTDDLFLIKFPSGKYLFKTNTDDVELMEKKDSELNTYDPLSGFKWDIKSVDEAYKFEADGSCLEKSGSSGTPDEYKLKATKCINTPTQLFLIEDIDSKQDKKDDEREKVYDDEVEMVINPIFHGDNNKRDPYMYGNEPYRGRGHR
ncbi:hypothetical protein H312_01203 [Anncaliia algerae PRA339]|uniref:Ricin B lectin domain-containing protein n=1 Tax=Anncaliia algerae PRA339 TaxID=1288291 RepID=A0A059F2T6_9MICR|nr:hypothetical protein H312_01203 [Anncaliia algerae PRA339]